MSLGRHGLYAYDVEEGECEEEEWGEEWDACGYDGGGDLGGGGSEAGFYIYVVGQSRGAWMLR